MRKLRHRLNDVSQVIPQVGGQLQVHTPHIDPEMKSASDNSKFSSFTSGPPLPVRVN